MPSSPATPRRSRSRTPAETCRRTAASSCARTTRSSSNGAPTSLRAEISTRIRVGPYVVDEERVSGHPAGDFHVVAVYRLDDEGLIDRVRFLR
jgi:hypothetical protein